MSMHFLCKITYLKILLGLVKTDCNFDVCQGFVFVILLMVDQ